MAALVMIMVDGVSLIMMSSPDHTVESIFTILHELGHIVLNHTEDSDYADKEADFFAKFAQCPPVLIHKLGIRDVGGIMNHFDISYGAACNALDYYNKWLRFGGNYYKDYEIRTCELFGFAV